MRVKFTLGMILLSTSAMMRLMSPAWIAASDLMVLSTSVERRLTMASGASSCARAGRERLATAIVAAASQERRFNMWFPFEAIVGRAAVIAD